MVNKSSAMVLKGFLSDKLLNMLVMAPQTQNRRISPRSFQPLKYGTIIIWIMNYKCDYFSNDRMQMNLGWFAQTNLEVMVSWLNGFEDNYYKNINEDIKSPDYYINPN